MGKLFSLTFLVLIGMTLNFSLTPLQHFLTSTLNIWYFNCVLHPRLDWTRPKPGAWRLDPLQLSCNAFKKYISKGPNYFIHSLWQQTEHQTLIGAMSTHSRCGLQICLFSDSWTLQRETATPIGIWQSFHQTDKSNFCLTVTARRAASGTPRQHPVKLQSAKFKLQK